MIDEDDLRHLRASADLAEEALAGGNGPFGSVLVVDGVVRRSERNREADTGDGTQHPELAIARWAATHLTPEERARARVYTSGEHCPMCAAAHAWVGLGRIVYAVSAEQLGRWRSGWGLPPAPVAALPIQQVAPGLTVDGPVPELEERMHALHQRSADPRASPA